MSNYFVKVDSLSGEKSGNNVERTVLSFILKYIIYKIPTIEAVLKDHIGKDVPYIIITGGRDITAHDIRSSSL